MEEQTRQRERTREKAAEAPKIAARESSGKCPHCGAALDGTYEFCPVCGGKLVDYCTFCGAPMQPEDVDCPECGMPAEGVICPRCNIRNYRPFCGQCGQPLSRAARRAVEKAKQDPKVREAARLLMQIAELEAELDGVVSEEGAEGESEEPTVGEQRLREWMAKVGFTPAELPKAGKRRIGRSREEVMAEYRKAVEEANRVMEEMLPPPGCTPQEQRNYYTARKVAVMETVQETWRGVPIQETMAWECNYCKVLHNNPSECSRPELGGRWVPATLCNVVSSGGQLFTTNVEKKVYKRQ